MAIQMLYQGDLGQAEVREVLARFDPYGVFRAEVEEFEDEERSDEAPHAEAEVLGAAFEYARELALGAEARLGEIDDLIRSQAENWRLERMAPVDPRRPMRSCVRCRHAL
jgi:transcription termination factor NusB